MRSFAVLYLKELRDAARDQRTLVASFSYAVFGPLMVWFVVTVLAQAHANRPQYVRLCDSGSRPVISSPALLAFLGNEGFRENPQAAVCMRLAPNFSQALAGTGEQPARLTIVSRGDDSESTDNLRRALDRFSAQVTAQRLILKGVVPNTAQPLDVAVEHDGSSTLALVLVGMLIPFFVCAPIVAGLATAIDATAGERERRSLEPLLAQPVSWFNLTLAKWCMTASVAVAGLALTVVVGFLTLGAAPLPDLGVRLELGWPSAARVFALLLPLTLSIAAVQLLIGLAAKSHKEGQSYLTLLTFVPVTAGILAAFAPPGGVFQKPIPMLWEVTALRGPLLGAPLDSSAAALAIAANLLLCAAALWWTTRRLSTLTERA
jgi:sodium transport system permease protein